MIAGGVAGGIEILVMYPTESVKTMMQLQKKSATPKYKGPLDCVRVTIAEKGISGLYRGLPTLLFGSIPKGSVRFGAFEEFKKLLMDENGKMTSGRNFLAGLGAGITEAVVVVTPMEMIKVRMIDDMNAAKPKYSGLINCIGTIYKTEGLSAFYKGVGPTIVKQASNQAIRFMVFNSIKDHLTGGDSKVQLPAWQTAAAGAAAGAVSVFGNNPIDVVKSRMQGLQASEYKNGLDCFFQILRKEGPAYFYKGVAPRLTRVTGDVAIVFTLYDYIYNFLDVVWKTD